MPKVQLAASATALPEPPKTCRQAIEAAIEALVGLLDAFEPDADDEPSLGSREGVRADQRDWALPADGGTDREGDFSDFEPSLGSRSTASQIGWALGSTDDDREDDRTDSAPSGGDL